MHQVEEPGQPLATTLSKSAEDGRAQEPEGGATAAAPPGLILSSMHQVEEPGQPLAIAWSSLAEAAVDDPAEDEPQEEDGNEIEVGASGDESQEEREGTTKSETEELAFVRQVRAVRRSHPPQQKVATVRLGRFQASRLQSGVAVDMDVLMAVTLHPNVPREMFDLEQLCMTYQDVNKPKDFVSHHTHVSLTRKFELFERSPDAFFILAIM